MVTNKLIVSFLAYVSNFLVWILMLAPCGWAQDVFVESQEQAETFLADGWKIDFRETAGLVEKNDFLDIETLQMGVPVAPYQFRIEGNQIELSDAEAKFPFKFQSFDKASREMVLELDTPPGKVMLQLEIRNENLIVIKQNMTIAGPLFLAYERVRDPGKNNSNHGEQAESTMKPLLGAWQLNRTATENLWRREFDEKSIRGLTILLERQAANCEQVEIGDRVLTYLPHETSESFRNTSSDGKTFLLQSQLDQQKLLLEVLGPEVILLCDIRRDLIAVYQKVIDSKGSEAAATQFDDADFAELTDEAKAFTESQVETLPFQNLARALSGTQPAEFSSEVGIDEIHIDRRWSAGAAAGVDLTTMNMQLFFRWRGIRSAMFGEYRIQLTKLDPVEDELGNRLDTAEFRERNRVLVERIRPSTFKDGSGGKYGPAVGLTIDAPGVGAESIQQIGGEAVVESVLPGWVCVTDARQKLNKPMQQALLGDSARIGLQSDSSEDELQVINVAGNNEFGSIVVLDRFGQRISEISRSVNTLGFNQKLPEYFEVWIRVETVQESQKYRFSFPEVSLPK